MAKAPIINIPFGAASRVPKDHRELDGAALWREVRPDLRKSIPLIGSKEALGHFPLLDSRPSALVPDPAYPFTRMRRFCAGEPDLLPLKERARILARPQEYPGGYPETRADLFFRIIPNNPAPRWLHGRS